MRGGERGTTEKSEESEDDDEDIAIEKPKNIIIQSSQRGAKLKEELLGKIIPWEKITVSLDNFPYYIEEDTKTLLKECLASNLQQSELRIHRSGLQSSSSRILLESISGCTIPGTEIYRDKLVSALAREMQVPLMNLDDDHGYDDDKRVDCVDDECCEYSNNEKDAFKKGDRVMYVGGTTGGPDISFREANKRALTYGSRGEVYEVDGKRVAVVFNICGMKTMDAEYEERNTELMQKAIVTWLDVGDVRHDLDARTHDSYIAMEMLYQVLQSQQPAIVYFSDSFLWPGSSYAYCEENDPFVKKAKMIFNQLPESVVLISSEKHWDIGRKTDSFPEPLKNYIKSVKIPETYRHSEVHKLFTNVICINPPLDRNLARTFVKQIGEDWLKVVSEGNFRLLQKVLKDHKLWCTNLEHPNVGDMILKRKDAAKIVGWATNHYLSSCPEPCVNDEILQIPHESIKLAISRLMKEDNYTSRLKNQHQDCDENKENKLASTVVCPGLKFDDVGGLEHVKKALYETVILPLKRPELFSHGNLLKPCKGVLLFGPSGTGKTLVAKALAMESGAKFMNITAATGASMTSIFYYAVQLAPVIIFVDELDSLLGATAYHHYAKNRLNEFVEAWDRLSSKDCQRLIVVGATNRPFDLDEDVISHMQRRIYVGLPDAKSCSKILKKFLNGENLESGFSFEQLAEATEGYSGSDLKNLCIAAAFRPLEEFLEQGNGEACNGVPALRPLSLNDFINAKAKVKPSVAANARSSIELRDWMEKYGDGEEQE